MLRENLRKTTYLWLVEPMVSLQDFPQQTPRPRPALGWMPLPCTIQWHPEWATATCQRLASPWSSLRAGKKSQLQRFNRFHLICPIKPMACLVFWLALHFFQTEHVFFSEVGAARSAEIPYPGPSRSPLGKASEILRFWPLKRLRKKNTIWLFNIAMGNDPFIDGLPIKNDDFPWLC